MAVLEALVIVTLILAGVWVGYNTWEHSLTEEPYDGAGAHHIPQPPRAELYTTTPHLTPRL